jgi:Fe-S-cluster containining protein
MIKPAEVKAKAQRLEDRNYKFRTFLKIRANADTLDAQFLKLHKELFAEYDCCKCNNCCKVYDTLLDDDEVERIRAFLGMTESDFAAEYLTDAKPVDEKPHKLKAKPCAFLENDGRCRIQDCKPDECKGFPYTDQPDRLSSMYSIIEHAEVCPIIFEILERLKVMYRFRNRT